MEHSYRRDKPRREYQRPEPDRRIGGGPKSQVRHCPSCFHPLEGLKHSSGIPRCSNNVYEVLNTYENDYLMHPRNQTANTLQNDDLYTGHVTSKPHHYSRMRHPSGHRRQRRNDQQVLMRDTAADSYCPLFMENGCRRDLHKLYCEIMSEAVEDSDIESEIQTRTTKDWRNSRQHGKNEPEDKNIRQWRNRDQENLRRMKLDLDVSRDDGRKYGDPGMDDLEEKRPKMKLCNDSLLGTMMSDNSDYTKERESQRQETETLHSQRRRKDSTVRKSVECKGEDESTNREEIKDDARCEIVVKDDEQETVIRKNIYAGGDLNLCATKSQILGLIDKALSNGFGSSTDQAKSVDSNRTLTKEIYIEIRRALQGDFCESLEDVLTNRGFSQECIQQLKMLRSEQMNHIRDMFRKLCKLQKLLDSYSPRQSSMSTSQMHPSAVKQRVVEERQQHDEK
ncbi:hypothetical protein WN55_08085 [Dufourea novaeangliae]|uniref:Uncharacterized protein n=1 Tax=Dufourea novaeangliae TaxID=178035 RepID=A0A154P7F2_DUFNO|nr:hypothetical protein WN55_08085 [Dufourea novaeangliae]